MLLFDKTLSYVTGIPEKTTFLLPLDKYLNLKEKK